VSGEQARPDFTGLWRANLEKSTLRAPAPREIVLEIEHREPRLVQSLLVSEAAGSERRLTFEYTTDGQASVNFVSGTPCETRARWEGTELLIESWLKRADRELHFKDYWSLSADGRTLTMAHRDDDLDGQVSVLEKVGPDRGGHDPGTEGHR
jgi:hypothetical protein